MAIINLDTEFKIFRRKIIIFSGTVEVEGSFAVRTVHLFKEQTGEFVGCVQSNPITGAWSIEVCDNANVKYCAMCVAVSNLINNQIYAHLTGV